MAGGVCPTLMQKSVTMHVLRHSAAMRLLHAGIDIAALGLTFAGLAGTQASSRRRGRRPAGDLLEIGFIHRLAELWIIEREFGIL
jgi:hypothetical protein